MSFTRIAATPVTHIGWGATQYLLPEIKQFDTARVLVVADPVLQQIGIIDLVLEPAAKAGIACTIYTGIIPEPLLETGQKLVDFARAGNYTLVIGIGGGS